MPKLKTEKQKLHYNKVLKLHEEKGYSAQLAQVSGRRNGSLPRCNGIKKGRGLASSAGLGGIPQGDG